MRFWSSEISVHTCSNKGTREKLGLHQFYRICFWRTVFTKHYSDPKKKRAESNSAAPSVSLQRNFASPELKCELRAKPEVIASEDIVSSTTANIFAVRSEGSERRVRRTARLNHGLCARLHLWFPNLDASEVVSASTPLHLVSARGWVRGDALLLRLESAAGPRNQDPVLEGGLQLQVAPQSNCSRRASELQAPPWRSSSSMTWETDLNGDEQQNIFTDWKRSSLSDQKQRRQRAELSEVLTVTAPSLMRTRRIYGAEFLCIYLFILALCLRGGGWWWWGGDGGGGVNMKRTVSITAWKDLEDRWFGFLQHSSLKQDTVVLRPSPSRCACARTILRRFQERFHCDQAVM